MQTVFYNREDEAVLAIKSGEEIQVMDSEYGRNEFLIGFLKEIGVWDCLISLRAKTKPNGKPQEALNGSLIFFNLAHLGALDKADPILRDGLLMTEVGFTLKEVEEKTDKDRGVIHRDTLRNHLKRVEISESKRVFYNCLLKFQKKKLLRGKIYAADGFKVQVFGSTYEGAGCTFDPKLGKWVKGYKVELIMSLTPEREYVVGIAIGPIQADERKLLVSILDDMIFHGISPRKMIDLLVLDRGYWGREFLTMLKEKYGIDYLTLVPENVGLHSDVMLMARSGDIDLTRVDLIKNQDYHVTQVGVVDHLPLYDRREKPSFLGRVIAYQMVDKRGEASWYVLLTSKRDKHPLTYVKLYFGRWAIENQGVHQLNQDWRIKRPIARSLNAIFAQIVMLIWLSNSVKLFSNKHPQAAQKTRELMKRYGKRSYLLGHGTIVFIPKRRIYTVMSGARLKELIKERTINQIEALIASGLRPEEALQRVRESN